jgi:hypothetical protein
MDNNFGGYGDSGGNMSAFGGGIGGYGANHEKFHADLANFGQAAVAQRALQQQQQQAALAGLMSQVDARAAALGLPSATHRDEAIAASLGQIGALNTKGYDVSDAAKAFGTGGLFGKSKVTPKTDVRTSVEALADAVKGGFVSATPTGWGLTAKGHLASFAPAMGLLGMAAIPGIGGLAGLGAGLGLMGLSSWASPSPVGVGATAGGLGKVANTLGGLMGSSPLAGIGSVASWGGRTMGSMQNLAEMASAANIAPGPPAPGMPDYGATDQMLAMGYAPVGMMDYGYNYPNAYAHAYA